MRRHAWLGHAIVLVNICQNRLRMRRLTQPCMHSFDLAPCLSEVSLFAKVTGRSLGYGQVAMVACEAVCLLSVKVVS